MNARILFFTTFCCSFLLASNTALSQSVIRQSSTNVSTQCQNSQPQETETDEELCTIIISPDLGEITIFDDEDFYIELVTEQDSDSITTSNTLSPSTIKPTSTILQSQAIDIDDIKIELEKLRKTVNQSSSSFQSVNQSSSSSQSVNQSSSSSQSINQSSSSSQSVNQSSSSSQSGILEINLNSANLGQPYILSISATSGTQLTGQITINGTVFKDLKDSSVEVDVSPLLAKGTQTIKITGNYQPVESSVEIKLSGPGIEVSQQTSGNGIIDQTLIVNVQ